MSVNKSSDQFYFSFCFYIDLLLLGSNDTFLLGSFE